MALATVMEHKTRSFLTVLGVIIGTGAVIAVGSIITGVNDVMTELVSAMGPETILSFQFNLSFRGSITPEELKRSRSPGSSRRNSRSVAHRSSTFRPTF